MEVQRPEGSVKQDPKQERNLPIATVSFARIRRGRDGKACLGRARQIGAIWPTKGNANVGILRWDHIPEELRSEGGVVFVFMRGRTGTRAESEAAELPAEV